MVDALRGEVRRHRCQVGRAHGLRPVAGLPGQAVCARPTSVDVVSRGTLEALQDVCERDGGCQPEKGVDVIRAAPRCEKETVAIACLAAEDSREPCVERRGEYRTAASRGPDNVN